MPSKNYFKVYASHADLDSIHAIAAAQRLPVSRLARDAILGRPIPTPPAAIPAINRAAYSDLGLVGNNLNQIARRLNQGSSPEADVAVPVANSRAIRGCSRRPRTSAS